MKHINIFLACILSLALTGCSTFKGEEFAKRKYLERTPHVKSDRDFNDVNTGITYAMNSNNTSVVEYQVPLVVLNTDNLKKTDFLETSSRKPSGDKKKMDEGDSKTPILALPAPVIEKPKVEFKKKQQAVSPAVVSEVLLVILAILIPPLAVFLSEGIGREFWIDLVLTLLFFLPGVIYALYVIFKK